MKMLRRIAYGVMLICFVSVSEAGAQSKAAEIAPRPPMGWNSWDAYGLTVDEVQFRANVDVMVKSLQKFGYRYVVVDEGWFLPDPERLHGTGEVKYELDAYGRYIPAPGRFPSAMEGGRNAGFRSLADFVHGQGLKFGLHIVRGIPRVSTDKNLPIAESGFHARDAADVADACPWDPTNYGVSDTPAGQAWYDSVIAQYAGWGVDFLKVDCVTDHPYKSAEIRMIHRAMVKTAKKTGRTMLLSLSPGPTSEGHAAEVRANAQMWRVSDDIWDRWKNGFGAVYDQFPRAAGWVPYTAPDSWPDEDMLPLGHLGPHPGYGKERETELSHDEQRTLMTLWCMARSPLILGANLTKLDEWTLGLITNEDVLKIDQQSHDGMQQSREEDMISWTAEGDAGVHYLALFNAGEKVETLTRPFAFYGLPREKLAARELWSGKDFAASTSFEVSLPAHGVILLRLSGAN